jgi:CCR4-NOT transcriptional complex subunit CAF120
MLEEGGLLDMLHWIVALADVFKVCTFSLTRVVTPILTCPRFCKLYGRPRNFSFDPRDPNSLYFALPIGPHRDRQFLDRERASTARTLHARDASLIS